jgi:hypothetical protein
MVHMLKLNGTNQGEFYYNKNKNKNILLPILGPQGAKKNRYKDSNSKLK